jgi:hypothetical protein
MKRIKLLLVALSVAQMLATRSEAIPTNPDPVHNAAAVTWSNVPIALLDPTKDEHQHYNTDNLFGVAGKFKTYSVWDDNTYRYNALADRPLSKALDGQDYGHGYMQNAATYQYDGTVPAAAMPLFDINVVSYWEGAINGPRNNTNNVAINTKINFAPVPQPLNHDILVRFAPAYPRGPANGPIPTDFPSPGEIQPDGTWGGNPNPGGDGVLAYWTPSIRQLTFNSNVNWYYFAPGVDPKPGQFDFWTTALHEFGHILGLDHAGAAGTVMFGTQAGYVLDPTDPMMMRGIPFNNTGEVRALDGGTRDGSIALYSIAVPEPSFVALVLAGACLGSTVRSRRRKTT